LILNSTFFQVHCLKFLFKLVNISRSYDDILKGSRHGVYARLIATQTAHWVA